MYTLFNDPPRFDPGIIVAPGWRQLRVDFYTEINKIAKYYRNSSHFVTNEHILAKILLSSKAVFKGNPLKYAEAVRSQSESSITAWGLHSAWTNGRMPDKSWFYNNAVTELLVYDDSTFDEQAEFINWTDIEAVKVHHHPFDDVGMGIPNGRYLGGNKNGYAVISINVAKLMLQYEGYLKALSNSGAGTRFNPHNFIYSYVLVNMLKSHMDCALRNRLVTLFEGGIPTKNPRSHNIALNDLSLQVSNYLIRVLEFLQKGAFEFNKVVGNMPAFSAQYQPEVLMLPEIAPTRYVSWILDLARAPLLRFLLEYNNRAANYKNLYYINEIKRSYSQTINDKTIPNYISGQALNDFHQLGSLLNLRTGA